MALQMGRFFTSLAKQQAQRQGIFQASRAFATSVVNQRADKADMLVQDFIKQQQTFRALLDETSKVTLPVSGDDEQSIKKYVSSMDAVHSKLGVPSILESYVKGFDMAKDAAVDEADQGIEGTYRVPYKEMLEGMGDRMDIDSEFMSNLLGAVEKVEEQIGCELVLTGAGTESLAFEDPKAGVLFKKELQVLSSAYLKENFPEYSTMPSLKEIGEKMKLEAATELFKGIDEKADAIIAPMREQDGA